MTYSLEYGRTETASIRQELAALLHGAGTKVDCARLLAVIAGIAAREAGGMDENIHTQIGQRTLHAVSLAHGICAFYYAYGSRISGRSIFSGVDWRANACCNSPQRQIEYPARIETRAKR